MKIVTIARKPLSEKNVASNVLKHGCGALNVDECRIEGVKRQVIQGINSSSSSYVVAKERRISGPSTDGRWPSNLLLLGGQIVSEMDCQSGVSIGNVKNPYVYSDRQYDNASSSMFNGDKPQAPSNYADHGGASRFFKCFK